VLVPYTYGPVALLDSRMKLLAISISTRMSAVRTGGQSPSVFIDLIVLSHCRHLIEFAISLGMVGSKGEFGHLPGWLGDGGVVLCSVLYNLK